MPCLGRSGVPLVAPLSGVMPCLDAGASKTGHHTAERCDEGDAGASKTGHHTAERCDEGTLERPRQGIPPQSSGTREEEAKAQMPGAIPRNEANPRRTRRLRRRSRESRPPGAAEEKASAESGRKPRPGRRLRKRRPEAGCPEEKADPLRRLRE